MIRKLCSTEAGERVPISIFCLLTNTRSSRYPPKLIPGCHVIIRTTAAEDRDGRLLLSSLGIPFHGKQVN